jgi:hypothetical protein
MKELRLERNALLAALHETKRDLSSMGYAARRTADVVDREVQTRDLMGIADEGTTQ